MFGSPADPLRARLTEVDRVLRADPPQGPDGSGAPSHDEPPPARQPARSSRHRLLQGRMASVRAKASSRRRPSQPQPDVPEAQPSQPSDPSPRPDPRPVDPLPSTVTRPPPEIPFEEWLVNQAVSALELPPQRLRSRSRSRRRRRRRRASSSDSSNSPPSPSRRLLRNDTPLLQTAHHHPGALTENFLRQLRQSLSLSGIPSHLSSDRSSYPNLTSSFLMTAFLPSHPAFPVPAVREMQTLASALDFLVQGRLASATDVLSQRFRALEMSASEGWQVARHLELLPTPGVSSIPSALRSTAVRQFRAEQRSTVARPPVPQGRRPPLPPNRWVPRPQGSSFQLPAVPALPDGRDPVRDSEALQLQQARQTGRPPAPNQGNNRRRGNRGSNRR